MDAGGDKQNKQKEIEFFDAHAASGEYNVFTLQANDRIIASFVRLSGLRPGARILDIGCGSGTFTALLQRAGFVVSGIDISERLVAIGRKNYPGLDLIEGDAENLPFDDESADGVLLSAIVHHFPDPHRLAGETLRVLKR